MYVFVAAVVDVAMSRDTPPPSYYASHSSKFGYQMSTANIQWAKCVKVSPILRDTLRVTGSEKLFVTNYVFLAK